MTNTPITIRDYLAGIPANTPPYIPELHTDDCEDTTCTRCIPLTPERETDIRNAAAAYGKHASTGFACCSAHAPADAVRELLAELDRVRAELADFAGRVNELEGRMCECQPVREHDDFKQPARYQHDALCPVTSA